MSRSVGIDIGTFSIKVAVVNQRNKQYWFDDFHEIPLDSSPTADNQIAIIDGLRKIGEKYDDGKTQFILGLPQKFVSSRICSFPFKERHKILKSVAFELEDDVPFTSEDAIFDAKINRYFKSISEVLAYAAPKEAIANYIQIAKDSRLPLSLLSVEGLAFANLFASWQDAPIDDKENFNPYEEIDNDDAEASSNKEPEQSLPRSDAHIVLHIGHSQTIVLFLQGKRLIDTRSLDWGGKQLCKALAGKYKIQASEANKELITKSFILLSNEDADKEQTVYSNTLKKSIDELHHQLQLIIIATESKFHVNLKEVLIVGGVSRIKNIGPYLTQKLERPVNRLKEFSMSPYVELEAGSKYGVNGGPAIGLAMEAFKKPVNPACNLLKEEFAQQSERWQKFWGTWATTIKYASAIFVIIFIYGMVREQMTSDMLSASKKALRKQAKVIARLSGSKANARNVKKFIKNQKGEIKAIEMAGKVKNIGSSLDLLKKLSNQMPSKKNVKLDVKVYSVVNGYMDIQGEVASRSELKKVEASLKSFASDGKVKSKSVTFKKTPGRIPFSYRLSVNIEGGA